MNIMYALITAVCLYGNDDCVYEVRARFDNLADCDAASSFLNVIEPDLYTIECQVEHYDN